MIKLRKTAAVAVAIDGNAGVFLASWKSRGFGMTPCVTVTVGVFESGDRQMIRLIPSDARRLAIALIEEATRVDDKAK